MRSLLQDEESKISFTKFPLRLSRGVGISRVTPLYPFQFNIMQKNGNDKKRKIHGGNGSKEIPVVAHESWEKHFKTFHEKKFMLLASPEMEGFAEAMQDSDPERFLFHKSIWDKFPDVSIIYFPFHLA